ncbi:cytochrome-c peroxidase [Starmerella bacillaris]|uniref:Peroxidase n=1 Tax=Starmerella bacillaris TaxID=1247836 RepID=A0AAV5RHZ5_STABA|nr:cytochrome-c peroxidase [Starmerella bacillaris]
MSEHNYAAVAKSIISILPRKDYDDESLGPLLVRLAWHSCATYDMATNTGGSNGATMRFRMEADDEGNSGLETGRMFLEPIKRQYPWISYADLWILAGCVSIKALGGPKIKWRPGRVDFVDESLTPPNGRLPIASKGSDHVRNVFYRMGFNDQEIVCLMGAHNLGRTHPNRSGYDGPWVTNPIKFSNEFYKLLMTNDWQYTSSPTGRMQYYNHDKSLMMLPSDMVLVQDKKFRKYVKIYALDKQRFFNDFALAFHKLNELGVPRR